jgi:hypothetical protein
MIGTRRHSLLLAAGTLVLLVLAGCDPRVEPVPASARGQTPRSAPTLAWVGRGRLEVVTPGRRFSGMAIVRGLGDGSARAAFLSDEGLLLADLTASAAGCTVHRAIDDLKDALPLLGRMVAQAYAAPRADEARAWRGDCLAAAAGKDTRWYGGDPVLLRCVSGDGLELRLEDYRPLGRELLAHEVRAEGPLGITIRLTLSSVEIPR